VARIPEEEIEQLKKEVDLAELVVRSGVALKKQGKDLVGACPFHEDDTPSLVVTTSKNLWHCLGACQTGGSVIDWVMKTQGISFRHAIEVLRAGAAPAITPGRASPVAALSRARKLPSPVDVSGEDQAMLSSVVDYYHATLLESPEALAYLSRRRIDDAEAVGRFRLGFANRTLGYRLPAKRTKEGDAVRGRLERLGVLRTSGHEHFSGSVVVPVVTPAGAVTELYGRKLRADPRTGQPAHLYLPGPHQGVWNEEGLSGGEVILTESLVDALTFFCAGFRNVTASYGTSGFTADHHEAFSRHGVLRVLLAYDHDAAGDTAAVKLATDLAAAGIECFRVVFPFGTDANDVAVSSPSPRDALGALVRAAEWMGAGTRRRTDPGQDDDRPDDGEKEPPLPSAASVSVSSPPPAPEVSPVPAMPSTPVLPATPASHDELVIELGPRRWRVRHIAKSPTPGVLRVNVMVAGGERFHVDTVDLYSAKQRAAYVDAAKTELRSDRDTIAAELGRVLLATEEAQAAAAAPSEPDGVAVMTTAEREAALSLLTAPDLMDQVAEAFVTLGVVGERTTALVAWLTLTSRLSDRPLGAVVQSSSSAGKSTLADAALSLMPTEQTVSYSAMTGQALYYLGETDLSHKVLSIAEEEGASRASYALKLLVSEGRLSIASAGKDPVTGRLVTHTYEVAGPVALLMTTTSAELDEELANRLLVLAVDEGRHQTRAVHIAQRDAETVEGLVARSVRAEVTALHTNAQRLLAPIAVVNPHAPSLAFSDQQTRARRDNAKYLGLIRAVVLAHQHQRPRKQVTVSGKTVTYIEATEADVAVADGLCADVLGTTTDELSPVSRRLLGAIESFVAERGDAMFTRRELRHATGFGDTQLKVHLSRLVDLEYVAANRAGPATTYELAPLTYDRDRSGANADRSGPESYRSGENPDRSGIGRVSRRSADGPLSQVEGHERGGGDGSVGIGRTTKINEKPLPSRENRSSVGDRSGLVRIHGTGEGEPAVVAGA
jgi:DNA primase catalytic core